MSVGDRGGVVGYVLGVDLGTSFVAAALAYSSSTRPTMCTLGDAAVTMPTAVFRTEEGGMIVGEAAVRRARNSPERLAVEFKRRLADRTPVMLGGEAAAPTMLLGTVLADVVARVGESQGRPPDRLVLTHPAHWGSVRRGLFTEVAGYAGVADTVLVSEAEATAVHHATSRHLAEGDLLAVYDLGGGTCDVTLLRARAGTAEIVGAPGGIEQLGGMDFDQAVLRFVDHVSGGAPGGSDTRDPLAAVALAQLRLECIAAKETLSSDLSATIPVLLPGEHSEVELTRAAFEDMVRAQVESTVMELSQTISSARVSADALSGVLLLGGSARIPLVARMVSEQLGRPVGVHPRPKHAVALGAAVLGCTTARPPAVLDRPGPVPPTGSAKQAGTGWAGAGPAPARSAAGFSVPGRAPAGQALAADSLGQAPVGQAPVGQAPTGSAPTGSAPPGSAPPGSAPPRSAPPRSAPPRSAPPRSAPPRSAPPGAAPPRSAPPEAAPPRSAPPEAAPPGDAPPLPAPPGPARPGSAPPRAAPPGRVPARPADAGSSEADGPTTPSWPARPRVPIPAPTPGPPGGHPPAAGRPRSVPPAPPPTGPPVRAPSGARHPYPGADRPDGEWQETAIWRPFVIGIALLALAVVVGVIVYAVVTRT